MTSFTSKAAPTNASILRPCLAQLLYKSCSTCLSNHIGSTSYHITPLVITSVGADTQTYTHFVDKINFQKQNTCQPVAGTHPGLKLMDDHCLSPCYCKHLDTYTAVRLTKHIAPCLLHYEQYLKNVQSLDWSSRLTLKLKIQHYTAFWNLFAL